jgi:phosphatidylserine/phosphatidylglycerophosphate/cardiolipin synthase-like enzyme
MSAVAIADNRGNLVFANAATGAVLGSLTLARGILSAPGLCLNGILYAGESTTQSTTLLHAWDASVSPIVDRWGSGMSVSGSVDAAPVNVDGVLWFATGSGTLVGIDNPQSSAPQLKAPVNVCIPAGAAGKVSALLAAGGGRTLVLVTAAGVYAADVSSGVAVPLWGLLGGQDLTGVAPVTIGDALFTASGNTLHTISGIGGSVAPPEDIELTADIAVLARMGSTYVLAGCTNGDFFLFSVSTKQTLGRFTMPASAGIAAWTRMVGSNIVSFTANGSMTLNSLTVGTNGVLKLTQSWSSSNSAFVAPPLEVGGVVAGVTTAGTLYTYDAEHQSVIVNGAAVLSAGATSAALTAMENVQSGATASVQLLLDGEEYFPALRNVLIAVLQGSFEAPSSLPTDLSFEGLIKAIGAAGKSAYVMMWNSSVLYTLTDNGNWTTTQIATTLGAAYFQALFNSNGAFRGDHRLNSQTAISLNGAPNVSVYLENYQSAPTGWFSPPFELGSNHQKIVIASVAGTRVALVSGFNTITPSYYDEKTHTLLNDSGTYDGESWHDAGIILTGSAVDAIESEFDRRWSKANAAPAPAGDTYVKFANWMIARNSILGPAVAPPPYSNPLPTSAAVPTQVAITSNETLSASSRVNPSALLTDVHQVLDNLVANIRQAASYIYFENFTFTSSEIVSALADKLKSGPASSFRIIVLVPHPTVSEFANQFTMELGQLKLTRLAYAALKLSSNDWDFYAVVDGDIVSNTDTTVVNFDDRGIENTTVTFTKGSSTRTVPISDVVSIHTSAAQPQVCFGSPARYFSTPPSDSGKALQGYAANFRGVYIHAKVALFDDAVALIGSANFNRRSMRADGELSVFVNDVSTVTAIRQKLFGHWNMTTPSAWYSDMNAFAAATADALGVLPLEYSSLPNQPVSFTWRFITTFVDPSQLL